MRVRREVGTDEPIEVVEVEQNYDTSHVPKCVFTQNLCLCKTEVYTGGLKIKHYAGQINNIGTKGRPHLILAVEWVLLLQLNASLRKTLE